MVDPSGDFPGRDRVRGVLEILVRDLVEFLLGGPVVLTIFGYYGRQKWWMSRDE